MKKPVDLFIFYPDSGLAASLLKRKGNYSLQMLLRKISSSDSYEVVVFTKDKSPSRFGRIKIIPAKLPHIWNAIRNRDQSHELLVVSQLYRLFPYAWVCKTITRSPLLLRTGGVYFGRQEIESRRLYLSKWHYWLAYKLCDHLLSTADGTPVDLYMERMKVKSYTKMLNGFPRLKKKADEARENIVVCISRLSAEKNIDYVINSFAKALARLDKPNRLMVVGDGPERKRLEGLSKELGIQDEVSFIGRRSNIEDFLYLAKLQLAGFSNNSVIEGIVTNTPTICVNLGETKRLYEQFRNVFVIDYDRGGYGPIPKSEYDSIVNITSSRIVDILNNYHLYSVHEEINFEEYGWDQRVRKELHLYRKILGIQ